VSTAAVLAQHTTRTIGSAGDARAVALYAELAAVTGSVARGFSTGPVPAGTTPETVPARARQLGRDLHLGATAAAAGADAQRSTGLFADLQSALDGLHAQLGQDLNRGLVEQLVLKL
jgi:hypothetical protein